MMLVPKPKRFPRRLRITAPGRDGGLAELIHALAVIVARLDRESQERGTPEPAQERERQPE
jgi:hypothetical protein